MGGSEPSELSRILEEQRAAAEYWQSYPSDRNAQLWLNDWVAEEILMILEERRGNPGPR